MLANCRPASGIALLTLSAALLASCSPGGNASQPPPAASTGVTLTSAQRRHIHLYTVVPISFKRGVSAPGVVDFDNDHATTIVAPFSGPVTQTLVSLGQHVDKNQPLAIVQSGDFAAAVGTYRKAAVTADNARKLAQADSDLVAHNGVSQREAAQAQVDAASAQADRTAALQALAALNVDGSTIRAIQAGHEVGRAGGIIRAPVAGTIVDKSVTPGQLLQAGTSPTFTVANLSRVWVQAQIASSDVPAVGVGDQADIDTGGGIIHGVVDNVGASVDPNTRAVLARVVATNPGGVLKKQMYVSVSIHSSRPKVGLLVPVSAVLRDDENLPFVYVALPDGSFARHRVTLGYSDGRRYELTDGVATGDRVVVDGAIFLQFMQNQ
jgi:cobalt-zinc-cadmium efflux system membrane fusion protein